MEALRWAAAAGDLDAAPVLADSVGSDEPALARAAFASYASLGAPLGPEPLLRRLERSLESWMLEDLARVPWEEIHRFLLERLSHPRRRGLLARLLRQGGPTELERWRIYRTLRQADAADVVDFLAARVEGEEAPAVAEILENRALVEGGRYPDKLLALWRHPDLLVRHLAAGKLLRAPEPEFLVEAMGFLGLPPFAPLDQAPASADSKRLVEAYAREHNPCLLVGDFLGSPQLDLSSLDQRLRQRFARGDFPPATPPGARFAHPGDEGTAQWLDALVEANPGTGAPLCRLWSLLAQVEQGGTPCSTSFCPGPASTVAGCTATWSTACRAPWPCSSPAGPIATCPCWMPPLPGSLRTAPWGCC